MPSSGEGTRQTENSGCKTPEAKHTQQRAQSGARASRVGQAGVRSQRPSQALARSFVFALREWEAGEASKQSGRHLTCVLIAPRRLMCRLCEEQVWGANKRLLQ